MSDIFIQNIPSRVFLGRLEANGNWYSIEIESAESVQVPSSSGTVLGIGSRVRISHNENRQQFWVVIDASHLPSNGPASLAQVKEWIPKCAVMLAAAVVAAKQAIPSSGIFYVGAPNYSKDPQRIDAAAFRRRCRLDVLSVIASCINSDPPEAFCRFSKLESAHTHTRIYRREDFEDAIQYWQNKRFIRLLDRAGDVQIDQTLDEEILREISDYSWDEAHPPQAQGSRPGGPPAEYDVFISHASGDKPAVVVPLAAELARRGLRVWVDFNELRLGDRLRQRIDDGLTRSRFGVVVISPTFFQRPWPQNELDGLVALEMADGQKRILPIWHELDYEAVALKSPSLAARLATKWSDGLTKVADEIERVVRG